MGFRPGGQPMSGHIRHHRDLRQSVCGLRATDVQRWETENPPRIDDTCEDYYTLLPEAQRPDDANHPLGDATLIDTLRRIVADRQHAKIDGVIVDVWSAAVTVLIWDQLRDDKRQRLLTLPSHELILRCVAISTRLTNNRNGGST
ncbi:hypothetical protein O7605_31795 [Verrucosispora sp. WMMA2121]|uniref:hypothetical protein n=1 Tax=Verrucosispora sp. WMMA2121 TaxID=3015164 RepID=UPI0022B69AD9|nr:hypothetical protein [Verrucosispora sp. WMMA2121]MCZ7423777.1 hypothetical protein [Verrucosispora sp. WMMA2121]MCZ7424081.1 hypothetical protein [Verrucosispora sp. WMMA2121]MCZ7424096.1 hypothetical protein [Verrucosispora sp. WMMA2121]